MSFRYYSNQENISSHDLTAQYTVHMLHLYSLKVLGIAGVSSHI